MHYPPAPPDTRQDSVSSSSPTAHAHGRRRFLGALAALTSGCRDFGGDGDRPESDAPGGAAPPAGTAPPPAGTPPPTTTPPSRPGIDWPVPEPVARYPSNPATFTALQTPAYLKQVKEPRERKSVSRESGRATELIRISDADAFARPQQGRWTNFGPAYASRQHWNADQTRMIIHAYDVAPDGSLNPHWLATAAHLLDGGTGAYLKPCMAGSRGLPQHWRWSNTDPDEVLFVEPNTATLQRYRPSRDAFDIAKSFAPAYDALTGDFNGGNGEPDRSGRYWALGARRAGAWFAVCWDRTADSILCEIPLPGEPGIGFLTDVTMSRSGRFVCVSATQPWTSGSTSIGRGVAVFDRSGRYQRSLDHTSSATDIIGHNGVALDSDGNDVWVYFYSRTGGDDRSIVSIRLDGGSDGFGRVEATPGIVLGAFYFISAALDAPDWVVVSDYPAMADNAVFNQFPYRGMIWAVRLDGTGRVYPISQARFSARDFKVNDWYYMIPWATPNRDMTAVLFKSSMSLDWSRESHDVFHAYLARAAR